MPIGSSQVRLPRRGKIWSWTVQRFRPKSPPYIGPEDFEPFAVGYVELAGAVIVEARLTNVAFDALKIGMEVETVLIPFASDAADNWPAYLRLPARGRRMMGDVFIVGAGIHPFGRTDGRSGTATGRLRRAARRWPTSGSTGATCSSASRGIRLRRAHADTIVNELGLTGLQFINVKNGCATGGSALFGAFSSIASGQFDLGVAIGFDKHPRGAFNALPSEYSLPEWYGETGLMLTTQFFAHEDQPLHGSRTASPCDLARPRSRKGVHQRRPHRDMPGGASRAGRGDHPQRPDGVRPADQVHVLLARPRAAWP